LNADARTENASGIISFHQAGPSRDEAASAAKAGSSLAKAASAAKAGKDLAALHKKLTDAGVVASLRADRKGQNYIRFSPHFYNTDAELQRALGLL